MPYRSALFVRPNLMWFALAASMLAVSADAAQFNLASPPGSVRFGDQVVLLPNGHIVVTDPFASAPGAMGGIDLAGAVHLFRADGSLIASLRGRRPGDQVGSGGVTVLANGHYVVRSPSWSSAAAVEVGAATWCDGQRGCSGVVSEDSSIIGAQAGDRVGNSGVLALANGNYLVHSPNWSNGSANQAGAVTWAAGHAPTAAVVGPSNSLVGSSEDDRVGLGLFDSVRPRSDGSYVVVTRAWSRDGIANAGAVTNCAAGGGCSGVIGVGNSLVGSAENDSVGASGVLLLRGGAYVVASQSWDNGMTPDAGAVTWCPASGCTGSVTPGNSLVGGSANDRVGRGGARAVGDGNYVVLSPQWDNGSDVNAGAATWCPGNSGCSGLVSASNSLVGSLGAQVGDYGLVSLANGHYVMATPDWRNGAVHAVGAVTWCNGESGCSGPISASNSLLGSRAFEMLGLRVTALTQGHYVVANPAWSDGPIQNVGAVTWCNGNQGCSGVQTAANSLIGTQTHDQVGASGVTALSDGHYVVGSALWDNGTRSNAGAATWCNGNSGRVGVVGAGNSLVGTSGNDYVGERVSALAGGSFVVSSTRWGNAGQLEVGAATWCVGGRACTGSVGASNSLVGSSAGDRVGSGGVLALGDGGYLVRSPEWDHGALVDAGAVAWGSGDGGLVGAVSPGNALVGSSAGDQLGTAQDQDFLNTGGRPQPLAGDWVMRHPLWDNGILNNAGAVTYGFGNGSTVGPIAATHSVMGTVGRTGNNRSPLPYAVDAERQVMVVGLPLGNSAVVLRPGPTTSTSIVAAAPDPSAPGQTVAITATVSGITAPVAGTVVISADSGEWCVATAAVWTSPTTSDFSCAIAFAATGPRQLRAEHYGTHSHGYSVSAAEPHAVVQVQVFADGFE